MSSFSFMEGGLGLQRAALTNGGISFTRFYHRYNEVRAFKVANNGLLRMSQWCNDITNIIHILDEKMIKKVDLGIALSHIH